MREKLRRRGPRHDTGRETGDVEIVVPTEKTTKEKKISWEWEYRIRSRKVKGE